MSENRRRNNKLGGYIAVTSAIFIAFLVVVITSALAFSTYVSRFNVLGSEEKETSLALAEACADIALLKLAEDPSYSGGEEFSISGQSNCTVAQVVAAGQEKTITTSAAYRGAASRVKVVVNQSSSIAVVSWEEP